MWAVILLGLLVGATASEQPSLWKPGYEYVYNVTATSLTALNQLANQWSGLTYNVTLVARPRSPRELQLRIYNAIYSRIHANLSGGFDNPIPEEYLHWKPLRLSKAPFDVLYKDGEIVDMLVDCSLTDAEVNQLKALASIFQVDIDPEKGSIFKKYEQTVTGDCMTQYARTPIPRYLLQSEQKIDLPEIIDGKAKLIDVTKELNNSRCRDDRLYYFGLDEKPFNSSSAPSLAHSSNSRAIVANMSQNNYLLGYAESTEKIVVSPFFYNQQKGMIASTVRAVLTEHFRLRKVVQAPTPECRTGGLLYNHVDSSEGRVHLTESGSVEDREQQSDEALESSESAAASYEAPRRYRRAVSPYQQHLPEPGLKKPPHHPYEALFVAVGGKSVLYDRQVNASRVAISLARDIGEALYNPILIAPKEALSKFPLLISLLRVFDEISLKRITEKLYSEQSPENPSSEYAWRAYYMALAQAGTGPALLNLIEIIDEDMISGRAAAEAFAYIPKAARTPIPGYVKQVFKFATGDASDKYPLNITAILAATELIHLAQVSNVSNSRYPKDNYEDLLGEYNPEYVKQLEDKLRRAVEDAYSPNIQLYIRALGNIGHPDIVKVFKPYLEGRRPVSTFQRFMMVMSLDKLAEAYPEIAQNIFLQLFQNTGETHEIRCASALLLVATNPPASVLQELAHFSNLDHNTQVKAAVKSIIQSAVSVLRPEDSELALAAKSALHLLTTEEYGLDKSFGDISSAVVEDFDLAYKQLSAFIGSVDSYVHSAASVKLQKFHGPLISHRSEVTSMVSSVRQLVRVLLNQTSESEPSSASDPARKLNIQRNVSEPLEGNILLDLFASKSFVAYDNITIELLKEFIQDELQDLRVGNSYNKTILANSASASIGLPSILGLPCNIKFDAPALVSVQVNATAEIHPDIEKLLLDPQQRLQSLSVKSEIQATYASQLNSKINIIFPLERKVYESSLVQNLQVYVPVKLHISHNLPQNLTTIKVQPLDKNQKYPLVRASRAPTTAVWSPIPLINAGENRRIVHVRPAVQAQRVFGKDSTGMAFIVDYKSEAEFIDREAAADHAKKFDVWSSVYFPWASDEIYYYNHTLYYAPEESSAKDVTIQIRALKKEYTKFFPGLESRSDEQSLESDDEEEPRSYRSMQRRHPKFHHKRAADSSAEDNYEQLVNQMKNRKLANADLFVKPLEQSLESFEKGILERGTSYILEMRVMFEQPRGGDYRLSLMHSRNTLRAVTLSDAEYWSKPARGRIYQASAEAIGLFPLLPEMNFEKAYSSNPNSTISFSYLSEYEGAKKSHIFAEFKAGRSERLKVQIGKSGIAKKCREQMREGNNILYACRNVTEESGLLDYFSVKGSFDDLSLGFINSTYQVYSYVRHLLYPFISEIPDLRAAHQVTSGRFDGHLWFSPKWDSFNASLNVPALSTNFTDVRGWPKGKVHLWLPHPSRHVAEKLSRGYQHRYVAPACSLDKRNMTTFDNLTIPLELPECWTLILSLVPKPVYDEELSYVNVSVLAMQEQSGARKFKIQIGKHYIEQESTKYIVVDRMKHNLRSDETTHVDVDGAVFAVGALLPSGSSWLSVPLYGLSLHYDGERALLLVNETYKDSARGLCGTYDGETVTDLTIPENCILKDPRHFVARYVIPETCQVDSVKRLQSEANNVPCYPYEIFPADKIVSRQYPSPYRAAARSVDSDESSASDEESASRGSGSKSPGNLRPVKVIKAVEHAGKLAFSIQKVKQCLPPLVADKVEWRKIPYHFINKTSAGLHWFQQVKKSPHNFDFSKKSKNGEIRTEIHLSCRRP
ncbi:vitellogenin-1-like [Schistocerca serialis cubense]|uniref:vitellogenin-1-like n=1 Tax=Schistocerca serialis cubense TaxID=2023355 RepID=UPI00214F2F51|nr:vitellogenin-1-like [Schistocerca serialis cubense]